jgi:putative GTP pyrophosphokinase
VVYSAIGAGTSGSMYGDDISRDSIKDVYPSVYPTLVRCTTMLRGLVTQFCANQGIKIQAIEARAKELDSLLDKFGRHPDYQWLSDSEDLCGIRVVTFYLEDVDLVRQVLRDEFEILKEEDRRAVQPETFGYQSVHMIARLPERRRELTEYSAFAGFKIEFQVRTVLQHAWGVISHALDYKTEGDVPAEVRRTLFRVAALLETGDELFGAFRREVQGLRAQYERQVTTEEWRRLPLNLESALLSWSRMPIDKVRNAALKAGFMPASESADRESDAREFRASLSWLVSLSRLGGAETINDLLKIINSVESARGQLALLIKESKRRGFTPVGDPCEVILLTLVLENPALRVRSGLAFRDELEDALDAVAHHKEVQ